MSTSPNDLTVLLRDDVAQVIGPWTRRTGLQIDGAAALLCADDSGRLSIEPAEDDPEYRVAVTPALLSALAPGNPLDDAALFELLAAWLWPVTWWSLRRRRARDWVLFLGEEVDNVLHVSLVHPDGTTRRRTWISMNAEWAQVPGHVFVPSTAFTWTVTDMREWLEHAIAATTSLDDWFWDEFTTWYNDFRARTAVRVPNEDRATRVLAELARYDHPDEVSEDGW